MSKRSKALVIARIAANKKIKPETWNKPHRGPWDKKKVKKADGGDVVDAGKPAFDPSQPFQPVDEKPPFDPSKPFEAAPTASEWPSKGSSWSDAITDIPGEIKNAAMENVDAIKNGLLPSGQGERGQLENLLNVGKGVAAIPGLIASPITGAARSLIGHPMAQAEHAVGTVINPEVAAKDDPEKMYNTAKGDVDLAMSAAAAKKPIAPVSGTPAPLKDIPAPTTKELFQAADQNYKNARGLGVEIDPKAVHGVADNILAELNTEGYRDYLAPKTYRAIDELKNQPGQNIEIADMEGVRRALNKAAADPAERDAARRSIDAIDKYLANLDPADVVVNPQYAGQVSSEAAEARGNYAAAKRSESLDNVEKKAQRQANSAGSGANIDNATRQQIKSILNNPKKQRGFSKEEIALMEKINEGTPVGNVARLLGKFAPSGVVSGALSAGAGFAAHGPMGAIALPAAGYAAKKVADASTLRLLAKLNNQVRARSPLGRQAAINAAAQSVFAQQRQPALLPGVSISLPQVRSPFSLGQLQGPIPASADDKQQ